MVLQWPNSYLMQEISLTAGILPYEWIFIAGIPLWLGIRFQKEGRLFFPFRKPTGKALLFTFLMTFALGIVIDMLIFWSEKILPPPPEIKVMLDRLMFVQSAPQGLWRWFLICLTPAFCEEVFFRGWFQNTLNRHWGKKTSLILTSVSFALIHGIPWYWHLYLILGFYLTWLGFAGRTLWLPIFAHLVNNTHTFLNHVFLGPEKGEDIISTDFAIFCVALTAFGLAAWRFRQECSYSAGSSPSRRL